MKRCMWTLKEFPLSHFGRKAVNRDGRNTYCLEVQRLFGRARKARGRGNLALANKYKAELYAMRGVDTHGYRGKGQGSPRQLDFTQEKDGGQITTYRGPPVEDWDGHRIVAKKIIKAVAAKHPGWLQNAAM